MHKIINPTIGSDFEIAVEEIDTGNIISAEGLIGGTKKEPLSIGKGCYRHLDCVAAEFNIPPVTTEGDFLYYINHCLNQCDIILGENYCYRFRSSHVFKQEELVTKASKEFGCSVSYDPYKTKTRKPSVRQAGNMRSYGFHLHVGVLKKVEEDTFTLSQVERFIKTLDLYLGVPSILIDKDSNRRKLYGKAGDFRYKDIYINNVEHRIVEYRVLGSNMMASNELVSYVWNQLHLGIEHYNNNKNLPDEDRIYNCINNSNEEEAALIAHEFNLDVLPIEVYSNSLTLKQIA